MPVDKAAIRRRVRHRIRRKMSGTAARPRLAVFRSLKHIYAQAIDDETGRDAGRGIDRRTRSCARRSPASGGGNVEAAKQVGARSAERLKAGRRRDGRLRSRRLPVPRPGQGAGRCGARGRTEVLSADSRTWRSRGERASRHAGELKDRVVHINRVTKVVKGGKNFSFSALVVVGDGNGWVGYGVGQGPRGARRRSPRASTRPSAT